MRPHILLAAIATMTACGRGEPFTAPTPWEDGELRLARISGSFRAEVDSPNPGAGTFEIRDTPYGDMSRVKLVNVGASSRVVQVQILDHSPAGWRVLELDIAENRWQPGPIPIDGNSAGGTLTEPDGSFMYLLRGRIDLRMGGTAQGQVVSASFSEIDLVEVP